MSNGFLGGRRQFLALAAGAGAAFAGACSRQEPPPSAGAPEASPPSQEASPPPEPAPEPRWNLSDLAEPPDWSRLDPWQGTITRDDFERLLRNVITDGDAWWTTVEIREDHALIRTSTARPDAPRYRLNFAPAAAGAGSPVLASPASAPGDRSPRYWRSPKEWPEPVDAERPLEGLRVALDPGHLGGVWAKMEGRWYRHKDDPPVKEGEMTLRVAEILKPMLEARGATATLVRTSLEPVTPLRPADLLEEARRNLQRGGLKAEISDDDLRMESERLFYRTAEIRARAKLVNETIRPDLVICLHFDASAWGGDPSNPVFSPVNHLHVLAHGCLSQAEFSLDDQRLDALLRLLQRVPDTEIPLCDVAARHLAAATGLPPFIYTGKSARRVNDNPYVWARNLLANRVYQCPVIFPEPWVMNSRLFLDRFLAGDYEGEAVVAGEKRRSLYREYAQALVDGLTEARRLLREA